MDITTLLDLTQNSTNISTSVQTSTSSSSTRDLLTSEYFLVTSYLTLVLVLAILTNGTVVAVFYTKPQLLTVSTNFVLNLSACQLGKLLLLSLCLHVAEWLFSAYLAYQLKKKKWKIALD